MMSNTPNWQSIALASFLGSLTSDPLRTLSTLLEQKRAAEAWDIQKQLSERQRQLAEEQWKMEKERFEIQKQQEELARKAAEQQLTYNQLTIASTVKNILDELNPEFRQNILSSIEKEITPEKFPQIFPRVIEEAYKWSKKIEIPAEEFEKYKEYLPYIRNLSVKKDKEGSKVSLEIGAVPNKNWLSIATQAQKQNLISPEEIFALAGQYKTSVTDEIKERLKILPEIEKTIEERFPNVPKHIRSSMALGMIFGVSSPFAPFMEWMQQKRETSLLSDLSLRGLTTQKIVEPVDESGIIKKVTPVRMNAFGQVIGTYPSSYEVDSTALNQILNSLKASPSDFPLIRKNKAKRFVDVVLSKMERLIEQNEVPPQIVNRIVFPAITANPEVVSMFLLSKLEAHQPSSREAQEFLSKSIRWLTNTPIGTEQVEKINIDKVREAAQVASVIVPVLDEIGKRVKEKKEPEYKELRELIRNLDNVKSIDSFVDVLLTIGDKAIVLGQKITNIPKEEKKLPSKTEGFRGYTF